MEGSDHHDCEKRTVDMPIPRLSFVHGIFPPTLHDFSADSSLFNMADEDAVSR